jgi:hypothetical protein
MNCKLTESIQSYRVHILLVLWAITGVSLLWTIVQPKQAEMHATIKTTNATELSLREDWSLSPTASPTTTTASMDLVIVTYSTTPIEQELLYRSIQVQQQQQQVTINDTKVIHVGAGIPLLVNDSLDWMFRFRTVVQAIQDELVARDNVDYVVLVGDASDAYLSPTTTSITHNGTISWSQQIVERFEQFNASIVLSGQIFCCNPMELRDVARAAWDEHYAALGGPSTLYKYLNAGIYVGYASAIVQMAHEMNVWEHRSYTAASHYHGLVQKHGAVSLNMSDVDINDDEWRMSLWYMHDQQKEQPMAVLDVHHALLATTPTARARHDKDRAGGNYFTVYATDTFVHYVGLWPTSFAKSDLERVTMCPYSHDAVARVWTNELTLAQPLVFHFAGNDWLCACHVLLTDHFEGPHKFVSYPDHYEYWKEPVRQGIVQASRSTDSTRDLKVYH